ASDVMLGRPTKRLTPLLATHRILAAPGASDQQTVRETEGEKKKLHAASLATGSPGHLRLFAPDFLCCPLSAFPCHSRAEADYPFEEPGGIYQRRRLPPQHPGCGPYEPTAPGRRTKIF